MVEVHLTRSQKADPRALRPVTTWRSHDHLFSLRQLHCQPPEAKSALLYEAHIAFKKLEATLGKALSGQSFPTVPSAKSFLTFQKLYRHHLNMLY